MRLILMGTGPFAVPTFESLDKTQHEIVALVTRPVRAGSARRKDSVNPVRDAFADRTIPTLAPDDVNALPVQQELAAMQPDLLVVCDFGQILSSPLLAVARLGGVNLHGSLLPKYRGAAPINWAVWNGESETGVTVIHMTPRLDAGPCLTQITTPIGPQDDAMVLETRLAQLGVDAVSQAIGMLEQWDGQSPLGEIQDPKLASRAPRLKKADGQVDWTRSAVAVANQVRALRPWPGTYTEWYRKRGALRLILDKVSVPVGAAPDRAAPGQIVEANADHLLVATGEGCLAIEQIQPAGKRIMPVAEFMRGYPVPVGSVLGSVPGGAPGHASQ